MMPTRALPRRAAALAAASSSPRRSRAAGSSMAPVTSQKRRLERTRPLVSSGSPAMPELTMIRSKSALSGNSSTSCEFQTMMGTSSSRSARMGISPFW